jgi:cell division protein FtsQ
MSRNRKRNSNNVLGRISKRIMAVLLIIGIPAVLFVSTFHIKKVEVVGSERYNAEQITEQVMKTKPDSNTLFLYLKYRYFTKVKIPFVEKVDVEMVNNHSVTINVYEKMVAGCVEFMGEYLYFDKDGIIVESSSIRLEDIPLIRGLQYDKIILNEKLEVQKNELFDVIINLTQLIEKYDLGVDTISFNNKYEVSVDCADIKVLLGKKSTYDEALSELTNILKEVEGMELTIDMRNYVKGTDNIIAKPKKPTD